VLFENLIVFADPAFKVTVIEGGLFTGAVKLVPVQETVFAAPPLTLTEKVRVPLTAQKIVSVWLPVAATATWLMVTEFAAPLPMKPTFLPPEQLVQATTRAAPAMVLPVASAS